MQHIQLKVVPTNILHCLGVNNECPQVQKPHPFYWHKTLTIICVEVLQVTLSFEPYLELGNVQSLGGQIFICH